MSNLLSAPIIEQTKKKETTTYDVGNPVPGFGQAQKCDRVKLVNGTPTLPSC